MEVRPIDAVQVLHNINLHHRPTPVSEFESGFNDGLNQAMWEITHAPTLTQPNEPLTWEELEKLKSSPVYIDMIGVNSYWALVRDINDCGVWLMTVDDIDDYGSHRLYGKTWLAYRRPPEGEEDT
jgi:hypothetical protein